MERFIGELRVDLYRGVIYFDSKEGPTILRIGGLPTLPPIEEVTSGQWDIRLDPSSVSTNWIQKEEGLDVK